MEPRLSKNSTDANTPSTSIPPRPLPHTNSYSIFRHHDVRSNTLILLHILLLILRFSSVFAQRCLKFPRSRRKPPRQSTNILYTCVVKQKFPLKLILISTLRTPQNTPANNAPISSHAQQPGVGTINEGMHITICPSPKFA